MAREAGEADPRAVEAGRSAFRRAILARKLIGHAVAIGAPRVALLMPGIDPDGRRQLGEAFAAAALAAVYPSPSLKRSPPPAPRLRALRIHGVDTPLPLKRLRAEAAGNGLARWLGALPPNELSMSSYRARVDALAKAHGWEMQIESTVGNGTTVRIVTV